MRAAHGGAAVDERPIDDASGKRACRAADDGADRAEYAAECRAGSLEEERCHLSLYLSGKRKTPDMRRRQLGTSGDATTAACS